MGHSRDVQMPTMRRRDMFLRFQRYGHKWYAKTPLGEYAWSDSQGLYEWTRVNNKLQRISYTGGDLQASDKKGMWTFHTEGTAYKLGNRYAVRQYKNGVN